VSLEGPLQLRLLWLSPTDGEPVGGYRIIAIDNERRLVAHILDVAPGVTSFALHNEAAQSFSTTIGYAGEELDDGDGLTIAPGHTYSLFIATFNATGRAGQPG
jgi:hypothetical protein